MKFKVITAAVVVFTSLPVAFSDEASSCGLRASHSLAREKSRGKCTAHLTFVLLDWADNYLIRHSTLLYIVVTSTKAGQTNRLRHLLHQNIFDVGASQGVSFGLRASASSAKKKNGKYISSWPWKICLAFLSHVLFVYYILAVTSPGVAQAGTRIERRVAAKPGTLSCHLIQSRSAWQSFSQFSFLHIHLLLS